MAGVEIGDHVRLLRLEQWFYQGLEDEARWFLETCVGQTTHVVGFDEYGHAELEFVASNSDSSRRIHTIWVAQDWLEKV